MSHGPSIHLDRASFDCSAANYRSFWHALKLRSVLHSRIYSRVLGGRRQQHAAPDAIVLMDRSSCERGGASARSNATKGSATKGSAKAARCKTGRGAKHHAAMLGLRLSRKHSRMQEPPAALPS